MEAACGADGLADALQARDGRLFLQTIVDILRTNPGSFPKLRAQLAQQFTEAHHDLDEFILSCLETALSTPDISPALAHLILDTLADVQSKQDPQQAQQDGDAAASAGCTEVQRRAASLLLQCCHDQPRLAAKVAAAFGLTTAHLTPAQQGALLDAISALLDANATSACAISLLLLPGLSPLLSFFHLEAVLEDLVLSSQDAVATRLVRELGSRELQVLYVQYCLQYGQLRCANAAVKQFKLQAEFPDVERMHKSKQLEKMVSKGLWGVAGQYVGSDPELQRSLLQSMLVAGELSLAQQHQQMFGLESAFEIDPAQLAAERARRREQFLQMPLAPGAVHFVDSVHSVHSMGRCLGALLAPHHRHGAAHSPLAPAQESTAVAAPGQQTAAAAAGPGSAADGMARPWAEAAGAADRDAELLPALGIDLEWQPDSENSSPPSLLQISTDSEVFVVDLLALTGPAEETALAAALGPVLASNTVYKLGCGVASDCKKLGAHHPAAFGVTRACLDLSAVWRAHCIEQTGKRSTAGFKRRAGEVSLSALSQAVLGKPLDKSCQVSDWGRRPLSGQQVTYAALDAHAAVLIFRGLGQLHHPLRTRQGLAQHAFDVDLRQGPAARRGNGGGGTGGSNGGNGGGNSGNGNGRGGGGGGGGSKHSSTNNHGANHHEAPGRQAGGGGSSSGNGNGASPGGGAMAGQEGAAQLGTSPPGGVGGSGGSSSVAAAAFGAQLRPNSGGKSSGMLGKHRLRRGWLTPAPGAQLRLGRGALPGVGACAVLRLVPPLLRLFAPCCRHGAPAHMARVIHF